MIVLKNFRKELRLSQTEFGKLFNVATTTISQWEKGTREPDIKTLIKLAKYFNVSVDYLIGNEEIKKDTVKSDLTEEEKQILNYYKSISDKYKGMAQGYLQALAEKEEQKRII